MCVGDKMSVVKTDDDGTSVIVSQWIIESKTVDGDINITNKLNIIYFK